MGLFSWLKKEAKPPEKKLTKAAESKTEQKFVFTDKDREMMDLCGPYADIIKAGKSMETVKIDAPTIDFETRYVLSGLRTYKLGSKTGILLDGQNRGVAQEDLISLNPFLAQGNFEAADIPLFHIDRVRICFQTERPREGSYSALEITPPTPTGKQPKYPLFLHFYLQDQREHWKIMEHGGQEIFGHVGYLKDGTIGKADVVCWSFKNRQGDCYYFHIRKKENELYLSKVEKTTE